MVSRPVALLLTAASCYALGCSEKTPRTQLMIVADTNISNLQAIRFEISGRDDRNESAETSLPSDGPAMLALVQAGGSAGPLTITAKALRLGRTVVQRSAVVEFVPRQTRVVELHLLERCVGVICSTGTSCTEQGCQNDELTSDDLPAWQGEAPSLGGVSTDASVQDAGSDAASDASSSDAGDSALADSGLTNCGAGPAMAVDLQSNIEHCGVCRNACKPPRNATAMCVDGECTWECRLLYDDCDDNETNGCEQVLNTDAHCGSCDNACGAGTTCNRLQGMCR
jgi:hypothetical protein